MQITMIHSRENPRNPLQPSSSLAFHEIPEFSQFIRESYSVSQKRSCSSGSSNPYALLPDTLNFLVELMERLNLSNIMEFGCGQSTYIFTNWAVANNGHIVSVEHDSPWIETMRNTIGNDAGKVLSLVHSPLRTRLCGARLFFTYKSMENLIENIRKAQFILIDGPHVSGREVVLYFVLNYCNPDTVIVVDDFNLYPIRDMLVSIPKRLAGCFAGVALEDNSHGLYVLRCLQLPEPTPLPVVNFLAIARSYWRCLLDYQKYGTGDSKIRQTVSS